MFSLLPMTKVISLIAGIYAILAILVTLGMERLGMPVSPLRVFSGAAVVDLGLLFFVYLGWRWIWVKVPKLNRWFYPDLNGMWSRVWKGVHQTELLYDFDRDGCRSIRVTHHRPISKKRSRILAPTPALHL
jgi:hypothetical protein